MLLKFFDFLQPAYYKLEKAVAAKSIPAVYEILNRKTLASITDDKKNAVCFDHSAWDKLLKTHIVSQDGTIGEVQGVHLVDYDGMAADAQFDAYLQHLATAEPKALSEPEQLAFWINAYNALCISLLVQYQKNNKTPLQSINDLSKPDKPVWDQPAGTVGGKVVSLNDIEHTELRSTWDEPAVHGSIVCASASCPNLRPEAFVGDRVRQQMDNQMLTWMKNPTKGLVLSENKRRLDLSRIFLWFGDDFGGWEGLRKWLPQYIEDEEVKKLIAENKVKVRFFEYSWEMNRGQP